MPTIRTHCSGGELFGVGARAAGFRHVEGFEIDPKIAAVARLNGFDVRAADVCQVDYTELAPVDHFHTSPSCKRASRANTLAGETVDDLAVADSVVRAIHAHAGRTFSLENVIEYRWFESYDRIVQALRQCGFVFRVVPKGGESPIWRDTVPLWHDAGEFVDAADFGVPQNRKRLILRAVRGVDRLPGLRPTHSRRGGILLEKWRGWYGAIDDLIPSLPDTTPAKWQLARMPKELRETLLVEKHGAGGDRMLIARRASEPAWTMRAVDRQEECAIAYVVSSGSNGLHEGGVPIRDSAEPVMMIRAGRIPPHRAYTAGRWVRMDIRALGRFQSVPDSYLGLTPEINGNGVPCDLAEQIMVSLRGVTQ